MLDGSELTSLLYVSHSLVGDAGSVRQIVMASRLRNVRLGVTGALASVGDRFAQVLEGSRASIDELMRDISADPRHEKINVLFCRPIGQRDFARWALAYWSLASATPILARGAMDIAIAAADAGEADALYELIRGKSL
ncbi:Sensors of blue-light using FAD [Sphingomonas sp. YR710]|uniref:BLUF domain-containing protein n=1 Tax=Sphingomonas sp. YR710 TaxID=1882773 RepID=UPI00088660BD|nr:BLUF domain-containing protein [Sphingomonas sp. YR710]SDC11120.1 Sensors of blue-light using FAD [Sphingomonas sp. YR710]